MTVPFLSADYLESFILVLVRVSAIVVVIPVLSENSVPARIKAGLAVIISVVIFPLVVNQIPSTKNYHILELIILITGEVLIGLTIGFTARLVFAAIQIAGDIIGFQMGFAVANVIDPMSAQMVSIITQLKYLIAMLLFITVDAHHLFFQAIIQSYQFVAVLNFHFSPNLMQLLFVTSKEMFVIALKIAAPLMAVMIFTNVALGVVARTVPQMNIFIVGFPLQISMGLIFIGLTSPLFVRMTQAIFNNLEGKLISVLRLM